MLFLNGATATSIYLASCNCASFFSTSTWGCVWNLCFSILWQQFCVKPLLQHLMTTVLAIDLRELLQTRTDLNIVTNGWSGFILTYRFPSKQPTILKSYGDSKMWYYEYSNHLKICYSLSVSGLWLLVTTLIARLTNLYNATLFMAEVTVYGTAQSDRLARFLVYP